MYFFAPSDTTITSSTSQSVSKYMNFKMICDKGGSQTRTLREVYHFVKTQLEYLLLHPEIKDTYFMNILDGDESFRNMEKFKYLLSKEKYALVKDYIFVE